MTEFTAELKDLGVPNDLIEKIVNRFAGSSIYIPQKYKELDKSERNALIASKFNGHNHKDLMREFELSQYTIYQIVAQASSLKA